MKLNTLRTLGLAVLFSPLLALAAPANFSGSWLLDKSRSKNLPPPRQSISRHHLAVTQDAGTMRVGVEIENSRPEIPRFTTAFNYQLNGKEIAGECDVLTSNGPAKVPATFRAEPQDDGSIAITVVRSLNRGGETLQLTSKEHWTMDPDGKHLTIKLVEPIPGGGTHESVLAFAREG